MISLVIRSQNTKASIDDYKFFDNVEIKKISVADENITFKIPRELNE